MYNVKYRWPDTQYESTLFEPLKQIRISYAMFKVNSVVSMGPNLKSFGSLEGYIKCLEAQLTNIVRNPGHNKTSL